MAALKEGLLAFEDADFDRQLARNGTDLQQTKERAARLDIDWLSLLDIRTSVREEMSFLAGREATPERSVNEKLSVGLARELGEWPKETAKLQRVAEVTGASKGTRGYSPKPRKLVKLSFMDKLPNLNIFRPWTRSPIPLPRGRHAAARAGRPRRAAGDGPRSRWSGCAAACRRRAC